MSDDGIGCYIFNNLSNLNGIKLINAENVPENYVSKIIKLKPKLLIGIDAVGFSSHPGEIKLFNEEEILNYSSSTHSISLKMIIDRIREELDFSFHLVGIQPKNIMLGNDFSEEVLNSANMLIRLIKSLYT
ncbi:MAG TPA: hydrogenase maturation protease [Caldisericia bacterium]|nr:hydrogenase maturation protease [Caldisericia bacterium]